MDENREDAGDAAQSVCVPLQTMEPARVLAWSEARVDDDGESGPALALWLPRGVSVALGLAQKTDLELDCEAVRRDGIGLVRRQSGGGAVLLYPGVLCWEAWASFEAIESGAGSSGIRETYRFLSGPVMEGLRRMGLEPFQAGICDISVPGEGGGEALKLAGTAQLRRRRKALVHGSLLVDADVGLLGRYLKMPSQQPEYRIGRSHRDFCVTVAEALGGGWAKGDLLSRVARRIREATAEAGWRETSPPSELDPAALELFRGKYANGEWNWNKHR